MVALIEWTAAALVLPRPNFPSFIDLSELFEVPSTLRLPRFSCYKLFISEVVLGTAFGVLVGPYGWGIFDPHSWGSSHKVTLEVMRVVLAIGLFAIGVELPRNYMARHAKGLLVMVVPTMAFGWVTVAGVLRVLFKDLNFVSCLAIAACLTPTDPIICAAIVGGNFALKHVPVNIRHMLSAEAAANDGLAYPFLSISIYLTVESSKRVAVEKWLIIGWLCMFSGYIDHESYIAQYLALTLFTVGIATTVGSDDLLAAFAAGTAVSWDGDFNVQTEGEAFASVHGSGAELFEAFVDPLLGVTPGRLMILLAAILVLRRVPSLLVLYRWIPEIESWREALFVGHFVGAIFVSTLALTRLPDPQDPPQNQQELLAAMLQPIVSFVVLGSIIIRECNRP
ncbi:Sodium/hydrogen exchanger [Armillaria novae-zelandiae]|uniref:Sodium/hydrogen exchanger n=1 Tax=Armillaria novae-zelandiae TaxID=153914 RepID=A0AA39P1F2_9AGAR|nr:Sodium/hydrogen exchanger [Armillaria novae-zelandiae]